MRMKKALAILTAVCTVTASMCFATVAHAADKTDLVIALDADIDTLHATNYSTGVEQDVLNQIYDTLMYYNPDGKHDPEPRIAESYEVSEDGLDYTFHLRDDAKFHDGAAVTADDVVFSLELFKQSEYQGSQISMLSSVEATDDKTVVCHLDTPYAPFLQGVLTPYICEKAYYEKDEDAFATNPIGSGPYKFVSRATGSNITLEANEDYYRGAPEIKNLTFEVIPDAATKAIALQTGEVNFAEVDSSVLPQLQANSAIKIAEVENSGFAYVSMNLEKKPFNNEKVSQAINYAIDRDNLVSVCYDGEAEVNSNICAKERFGYSDDQPQYTYDPDKAKELLALLVHYEGNWVPIDKITFCLLENCEEHSSKNYSRTILYRLKQALAPYHLEQIVESAYGKMRVHTEQFTCDYYDYLQGQTELFQGDYMGEYPWAETTRAAMWTKMVK